MGLVRLELTDEKCTPVKLIYKTQKKLEPSRPTWIYGAIYTSELDRSEIDVQSDLNVNAQMRTKIDPRSI